ncbi:MAG: phosphotransferase [Chloroflexia bacterium]|nr:phosphotransferase [Chloroflexia bacterium]
MPSREQEIVLKGGNENVVVQVGETVRRPVHPWTPAVHVLLRSLEANGFADSPRVLGFDERGREMLTMIPGEVGNYPLTPAMMTEASLVACARMLRRYHGAATIQPGWGDLPWRYRDPDSNRWEVICHSDVAPYNIVYREGLPVGLIDFDVAGPGPKLWDIAYAAFRLAPLSSDAGCLALGFAAPPDRIGRLTRFCDAYGLEDATGLLEMAIVRIEGLRDDILERAAAGDPGVATHLAEDHVGSYNADLQWIRENEAALRAALL